MLLQLLFFFEEEVVTPVMKHLIAKFTLFAFFFIVTVFTLHVLSKHYFMNM